MTRHEAPSVRRVTDRSAMGVLNQFPPDLLLNILQELEYKQITRCRGVCRLWHDIISHSSLLRYIVSLGIHSKVDGDRSFHPRAAADRLSSLLALESAWTSMKFRMHDSFDVDPEDRMRFAGVDAIERARGSGQGMAMTYDRLGSVLSGEKLSLGETIYPGVSEIQDRSARGSEWLDPSGRRFEDCFFDADNELFICESRKDDATRARKIFHLRWLHDPKLDHPLAAQPMLDTGDLLKFPSGSPLNTVRTMIIGNLVLVEMHNSNLPLHAHQLPRTGPPVASVVIVWNWTTGELIFRLRLEHHDGHIYTDLSLLSPTEFMVPVTRILSSGRTSATVQVYSFARSSPLPIDSDGIPRPRLLRTFFLPTLNDNLHVEFTCCSSLTNRSVWARGERETEILDYQRQAHVRAESMNVRPIETPLFIPKPFRPADDDRLCALIIETYIPHELWTPSDFPYGYVFVTRASTLLKEYPDGLDWIPWEQWGPRGAALLHGNSVDMRWGNCWYPHGWRIVVASKIGTVRQRDDVSNGTGQEYDDSDEEESIGISPYGARSYWGLSVLDFNPDRVRRSWLDAPSSWPPDVVPGDAPDTEPSGPLPGQQPTLGPNYNATSRSSSAPLSMKNIKLPIIRLVPQQHTVKTVPLVIGRYATPRIWAFKDWPLTAQLPFVVNEMRDRKWAADGLEMDMDTERILVVQTNYDASGAPMATKADVLTF
ncbi:hypothetical protein DL93DRAFT_2156494 [Clavulina sp. PMI_390]|nr:hypothetical protein DL93DRAFT_2156494 [Clavulina sp. PMI_390]